MRGFIRTESWIKHSTAARHLTNLTALTTVTNLARFLPDGTLDQSFRYSFTPGEEIKAVARQDENKLLIGGNFLSVNGSSQNFVSRLHTNYPRIDSVAFSNEGRPTLAIVAAPGSQVQVEYSIDLKTRTALTSVEAANSRRVVEDDSKLTGAVRFYRVIVAD